MDQPKMGKFENFVAFVLIVAICSFACYWGLIKPKIKEINTLSNSLRLIDSEIKTQQGGDMALKDVESSRAVIQKQLADISARVPGEVESPYLINNFISVVGKGLNIDYNLIQPGDIQQEDRYKRLPLRVEFEGSYANLNLYLAQLKNLPVTIRVDSMDIHKLGESDKLSIRMDLSAFVMPGGTERPDVKTVNASALKNPFVVRVAPSTSEAVQLRLEAPTPLKYTGYWMGQIMHAFLNDDVVKEGDIIQGYKVVRIYKDRVILSKNKKTYTLPLVSAQ